MGISVNCMILNEPFVFFGIASIIDIVDEVLVVDTGSEEKFYRPLLLAQELWKDKIRLSREEIGGDAHTWKYGPNGVYDDNKQLGAKLGDIRRKMQEDSKGKYILILDGDEIWNNNLAYYVKNFLIPQLDGDDKLVASHLPFIDLLDKDNIRHVHNMGRVFKKRCVTVISDYPLEMHYNKNTNKCITNQSEDNINVPPMRGFVLHMEHLLKPLRKQPTNVGRFSLTYPEVFAQYKDLFKSKCPECYEVINKFGLLN